MIRGIHIPPFLVTGAITMTFFMFRAISKFWSHPIVDFFITPIVVFVGFLIAGIIIIHPQLHGVKALILGPLLVVVVLFFVYAYYLI